MRNGKAGGKRFRSALHKRFNSLCPLQLSLTRFGLERFGHYADDARPRCIHYRAACGGRFSGEYADQYQNIYAYHNGDILQHAFKLRDTLKHAFRVADDPHAVHYTLGVDVPQSRAREVGRLRP